MIIAWLIVALIFILLEIGHPGLFLFLSFSAGALVSAGISALGSDLMPQIIGFFVSTVAAFFILTTWVKKTSPHTPKTNVYALQGKKGIVIAEINPTAPGSVKVAGEIWSARAAQEDATISVDTIVEIITVRGVHLIVTPVQ
jgi:membrane protein implicated in regulation of membrane protease activity